MAEMGSATLYIPENLRPSRTPSYSAFLSENNFTLLRPSKQEHPHLLRGPRRVFRLCFFALILPTLLITVPLYVRLVLYPPGHYPMMPTDQRLLSGHVSSIWCQGQSTHMNGTFTTYLSPDTPALKSERERYEMIYTTQLQDDIKEYWGFYLLKGSKVTVSTCSSREGAQLMILRGVENLRRCAWIGEKDSAEEIDEEIYRKEEEVNTEESEENENNFDNSSSLLTKLQPVLVDYEESDTKNESVRLDNTETSLDLNFTELPTYEDDSEERRQALQRLLQRAMKMSKGKKEILRILHSVGRGSEKPIPKRIRKMMGGFSDETNTSSTRFKPPTRSKGKNRRIQNNTDDINNVKVRMTRSVRQDHEENDGAFEVFDDTEFSDTGPEGKIRDSLEGAIRGHIFYPEGLKLERGKFNQTNRGDKSDEENYSSYSSSEEALASCQGVIMTLPLVAYRSCSYRWLDINKITYDIPVTGTYYFVYSSDNEIDLNRVYLNMTFEKVMYNVNESDIVCANSTDCSVPLTFMSKTKAVVEVPQESTWNNSYLLETTCEPRVAVYLTFLLLVPILILFCAFQ
ncbi:hypothetical protein SK128_019416 [Halocaridina rubra]|uniref:E3 ubiquitin-protein ligase APD1-4 middle domain-containing protein n=1 Tax=Halocaridina rubra TaxID=373956 RepID=A0AAN9A751_HALRR